MDDHFSACFRYFYGVLFNLKANTKGLIKDVAAFDVAFGETIQAKSSWFRTGDCHHWTQNGDSDDGKQRKCSSWHGHRSVSCEACSDCLDLFEPYSIVASYLADHMYLLYVLWLPYVSTCFLATPKITMIERCNGTLWCYYSWCFWCYRFQSLIFVIAGYRACFRKQFVPDDYCWIQFIQRRFLNDFNGF